MKEAGLYLLGATDRTEGRQWPLRRCYWTEEGLLREGVSDIGSCPSALHFIKGLSCFILLRRIDVKHCDCLARSG